MRDELATILRLVAEGKLAPDEAAPIIEALSAPPGARRTLRHDALGVSGRETHPGHHEAHAARDDTETGGRRVRIQVNERGRRVVDLRIPLAFAAVAARAVPGIPDSYAALIEQAVQSDTLGIIVDAEDESGDGVVIALE